VVEGGPPTHAPVTRLSPENLLSPGVTFHRAGHTHLYQLRSRLNIIAVTLIVIGVGWSVIVALEKLEGAVDHRWISVRLECGTRQFEQDDECIRLVVVQFWVRGERLEDVIVDRSFFHVSEVGPECDEVSVCVEMDHCFVTVREFQVILEKPAESPCAEAALEPSATWGKEMIRLRIPCQTNDQVSGGVDEPSVVRVYQPRCPVFPDGIGDLVRGDFGICLSYIEPKVTEGERMVVVLVG